MNRKLFAIAVLTCLASAQAGCSRAPAYESVPVFPLSGVVTYNGKPMQGAIVTFFSVNSKLTAQGTADAQGEYSLTTYLTDDGAPADDYTVTIYWPEESSQASANDPDPPLPPDRLKGAYASAKTSKLRATVEEDTETIDFKLP